MQRRSFLAFGGAGLAFAQSGAQRRGILDCDCSFAPFQTAGGQGAPSGFGGLQSGLKVTGMKVFGVSLTRTSDRPYVFCKLETNQGLVGWGEGTLEGKAGATMACVEDFRDFVIGADPMQVEHIWQSMYVHSFYRAGPVMGSAISAIDQALWDIRGKALGVPVYKLLGGPLDPRGVRGYYHADGVRTPEALAKLRETAVRQGVSCFKTGLPTYYEWIETRKKISAAVKSMQVLRESLGPDIDIAVDFHAKTSPSVASILVKEVEPLNLLFIEEPCPPENVQAMAKIARRSTTPIATGERLNRPAWLPRADRNGDCRYSPDRHQSRRRHYGPLEGVANGCGIGYLHGTPRLRRPHRRFGYFARELRNAELRCAGDLWANSAQRDGQDLAGMVRISGDAHGGRTISLGAKAWFGIRSD